MSILDADVTFVNIMQRLPPKSLISFKSVSNSFKSEISSQHFSQLYLNHNLISSTNNLLILPGDRHIICYDLDSFIPTATFPWHERGLLSVIGSCNGLLCVITRNYIDYLSILNPSTRICHDIRFPISGGRGHNYGFAFNYKNLDFKIVSVSDIHNKSALKTRISKVYSLNSNTWRTIEITLPTDSMEERHGGVLISNSLLHWMFWIPSLSKRRIGCFDVCKMKWTNNVLLPRDYYDPAYKKNYLFDIGVFDGCLFSLFENQVDSRFDVWVMKEYGVQDSWVKLVTVPVSYDVPGGVVPVAYRKGSSSEILMRQRHSSRLYWYNTINGELNGTEFDGAPDLSNRQAYMCSRSVINVPGGELFEET